MEHGKVPRERIPHSALPPHPLPLQNNASPSSDEQETLTQEEAELAEKGGWTGVRGDEGHQGWVGEMGSEGLGAWASGHLKALGGKGGRLDLWVPHFQLSLQSGSGARHGGHHGISDREVL